MGGQRQERAWTVGLDEGGELDRDEVLVALRDIEAIGHREGGMFIATPIRVPIVTAMLSYKDDQEQARQDRYHGPVYPELASQLSDMEETGEYATVGWKFTHAFAPAARVQQPEPVENGTQPEPVAAE